MAMSSSSCTAVGAILRAIAGEVRRVSVSLKETPSPAPEGKVHILHLDGRPQEVIVVKNLGTALDWAADGKGLFINNTTSQGNALTYLDLHGNTHQIWEQTGTHGLGGGSATWGIPSRDGRHLAINGSVRSSNVWLLENF